MALNIGNKVYRNLQEQVGYNSEQIDKIFSILDGIDYEDHVVVIEDISTPLNEEEMATVNEPVAFLVYQDKLYFKDSSDEEKLYFSAVVEIAGSDVVTISTLQISVDKTTGALAVITNSANVYSSDKTDEEIENAKSEINEDISELRTEIASVASGSPAGVYADITALRSADPDHSRIYLLTSDGDWYYWSTADEDWISGGDYQSPMTALSLENAFSLLSASSFISFDTDAGQITIPGYVFIADTNNNYLTWSSTIVSWTPDDQLRILLYNYETHEFTFPRYVSNIPPKCIPVLIYYAGYIPWSITRQVKVNGSIQPKVTTDYLADNSITGPKIIDGQIGDSKLGSNVNIQRYFAPYWYPNAPTKKYINFDLVNSKITIQNYLYADTRASVIGGSTDVSITKSDNFMVLCYNSSTNTFSLKTYSGTLTRWEMPLVVYIYSLAGYLEIVWANNVLVSVNGEEYHIQSEEIESDSVEPSMLTDLTKAYKLDEFSTFKTFGAVGDSLTEGLIQKSGGTYVVDKNLSWCKRLADKHGLTCHNFGISGATAKSWLNDKLSELLATEKCMCYTIGIGYNDHTIDGSVSDIDLLDPDNNGDTFYGNYAKIIQKIHAYAPDSIIFICTQPYTNRLNTPLNEIKTYLNIDEVHLIDLYAVRSIFNADFIHNHICTDNIHFNPMGYENIANAMYYIFSKYMKDNNSAFADCAFISY